MLTQAQLTSIGEGRCPDCAEPLISGPRGGMSQNLACMGCGAEFNAASFGGVVVMGHRNSKPGYPDRARLRDIFGITLGQT